MLQPPLPPRTADPSTVGPPLDPIASLRLALRGHYDIEREIGQGAFATVYLARDLKHERKVAVKVLHADPTSETGELRFIREIRLLARLQHPNILPLHDSGHVEALLYYVMPYVGGETLRDRIGREKQLSCEAACNIARDIADALAYAHGQGIIHRDIKPENILLSAGHPILADFGIARVIDLAGVRQVTRTGAASPGTPTYMSPEQLLGDRGVDSRSDIYSLGCVLYEMLAGKPPFPGKDGFVKRFTERPPHITSLRRDVPPWVDEVVAKALAKDPADRYPSASDFVAAVCQSVPPVRTPAREHTMRHALASPPLFETDPLEEQEMYHPFADSHPRKSSDAPQPELSSVAPSRLQRTIARARAHPMRATLGAVVVVALVAVAAAKSGSLAAVFGSPVAVDTGRFIILASTARSPNSSTVGAQVADSLYDALAKWDGAPVVSDATVAETVTDGGFQAGTADEAIVLARRLGAGKAAWVQGSGNPTNPRLRIHLYDARSAEALDEFAVPPGSRDAAFYSGAVLRLLGLTNRPAAAAGCDDRTRSYRAWRACNDGHTLLAAWKIADAERAFREAVNADAGYAPPRLWLAQVIAWRTPEKRTESYDLVRGAKESGLTTRDSLAAIGLNALLDQRFPSACSAYTQLTRLDSFDYLGWYGLGECQAFDSTVVRSPSPSGWAFRTSWHSAVKNYITALRVEPGAHVILGLSKIQSLLPVASTFMRTGFGDTPERQRFAAFPTLERGDTVGFVPYLPKEFADLERTPAADAALRRNVTLLYEYAVGAADRFPQSARAQEALAHALEARAELGADPARATGAMRAIDSAIALVMSAGEADEKRHDVPRLRARKIRIHFKRGEFAAARILADSLLAAPPAPSVSEELLWVAALTGRGDLAAQFYQPNLRTRTLRGGTVPPNVAVPASKYFMYAALGICGTSLTSTREELETALRDYITDDIRETLRADLAARPGFLSAPCTNAESALLLPAGGDRVILAQQAFARGQTQRARAMLVATANAQQKQRPGDLSPEYHYQQAWLRTQVGDTAAAESAIDGALGALPTFSAATLKDPGGAAAFGRLMALRAEIAAKRGDGRTARRWAGALNDLWASSDPPLRRVAGEVLSLATNSPR